MHTLSVIVPVYNEERTAAAILHRLFAMSLSPGWQREIIVVNDGSTDGTRDELTPFFSRITYREHERNLGKGAALRTGFSLAAGEFIAIQDADMEYGPEEISRLADALLFQPEWCAVYGSRNLAPTGRGYGLYILGVWFLTALVNLCFGSALSDVYTGHKAVRKSVLNAVSLRSRGFEIEMEITARILKNGGRIGEIPIPYQPRTKAQGKKIRAMDGLRGLIALLKVRFLE